MLDIQFIRDNKDVVQEKSKQKGYEVDIKHLLELDNNRRELITKVDELRQKRNEQAGQTKNQKPSKQQIAVGKELKEKIGATEAELQKIDQDYYKLLKQVPNMPLDDVPIGASEDDNQIAKTVGEPPKFDFEPKNHAELAQALGWIDKERAAKVSGARFAYVKGDLAKLHFALINWAISVVTDKETLQAIATKAGLKVSTKPFTLVLPPLMIRTDMYDAMDRLEPREDRYKIEGEDLWLQGSAEHVLGSMHAGEVIDEADLPVRYVGYATSFRREAGSYGKDMEGIFRLHQFEKLEMESLTSPEVALDEHLFMIAIQEHLMQELGLPYQVLNKCTADIGKPNAHGVDINTWLPAQKTYRETHTADYMTDYQARRLQTKLRRADGQTELVHTNDATVLSQRPLIAIIENYQNQDGSIRVPEVLKPYLKV